MDNDRFVFPMLLYDEFDSMPGAPEELLFLANLPL